MRPDRANEELAEIIGRIAEADAARALLADRLEQARTLGSQLRRELAAAMLRNSAPLVVAPNGRAFVLNQDRGVDERTGAVVLMQRRPGFEPTTLLPRPEALQA